MGLKLYSTFLAAGLPVPLMSLDSSIGGGKDSAGCLLVPEVIRSLLPLIEKFGIATAEQVDIDSLADRLQSEIVSGGGVTVSPGPLGCSPGNLQSNKFLWRSYFPLPAPSSRVKDIAGLIVPG